MFLFSAPIDFDLAVVREYNEYFGAKNIFWRSNEERTIPVFDSRFIDTWVCDPKAKEVINSKILERFPNLELLVTPSTGNNHINLDDCENAGVKVLSLLDDREGLETISASAEFTFKLLLDCFRKQPAMELQDKKVSLIGGAGRIGRRMTRWLIAFGAMPQVYDKVNGFPMGDEALHNRFKDADAVVICCTYSPETYHLVNADLLRTMKKDAILVNTSRGEVIDEYALAMVMEERPDLRVAVDVLEGETTGTQNPQRLISRGAIVTPHIAGETFDSRTKATRIALDLIKKFKANP